MRPADQRAQPSAKVLRQIDDGRVVVKEHDPILGVFRTRVVNLRAARRLRIDVRGVTLAEQLLHRSYLVARRANGCGQRRLRGKASRSRGSRRGASSRSAGGSRGDPDPSDEPEAPLGATAARRRT